MRYLISYIYHFFVSNSRHGTHSPFVYSLAEQVIYNPEYKCLSIVDYPEGFNPKYKDLLNKILGFWKLSEISKDINNPDPTVYWVNSSVKDINKLLELVDKGKVLIIHEPYKKNQAGLWKGLIEDERVTVSINLFHFGIVMKREGQRKEDFLLRQ